MAYNKSNNYAPARRDEQLPANVQQGQVPIASPMNVTGAVATGMSKAQAEVLARMQMARQLPRDEVRCIARITQACQREGLANAAMYSYPRGGTPVKGASIRLAEVLAQLWGNTDYGVWEVERRIGESDVVAHAWDLETNVRAERRFVVRHHRDTKTGGYTLTDERDIYEMVANQGARRLRACILSVIPGDVQDTALKACAKTIADGGTEPFRDKVRRMVSGFQKYGVTDAHIERKLGHPLSETTPEEFVDMTAIFNSIKDGAGKVSDYFGATAADEKPAAGSLGDRLKQRAEALAQPVAQEEDEEEDTSDPFADADEAPPATRL